MCGESRFHPMLWRHLGVPALALQVFAAGANAALPRTPVASFAPTSGLAITCADSLAGADGAVGRTVPAQSQQVTITTVAQPAAGGSIAGGGVYEMEQWVTLTATASNGYRFVCWLEDGVTDATRVDQAFEDTTYTAVFGQAVALQTAAWPAGGGQVSGGGVYGVGAVVTLTATPADGYRFGQWQDGLTDVERTVVVQPGLSFQATFVARGTVVGVAQPANAGTVTGGAVYDAGERVVLQAVASDLHFVFKNWTDGVTSPSRPVVVLAGMNVFTARFVNAVIVIGAASPAEAGLITPFPLPAAGTLADGAQFVSNVQKQVTLTATANRGWRFTNWSDGAGKPGPRKISLGADTNVTAVFIKQVKISVAANPTTGGTVSSGGTYDAGASVTIYAVPKTGWHFTGWDDGNQDAVRHVTVPAVDTTYTAQFAQQVTLQTGVSPAQAGVVRGGGTYDRGAWVTITAIPRPGYLFKQWQDKDTEASRTITVSKNVSYTASFAPAGTVEVLSVPPGAGGVTGGGVYFIGTVVTNTAYSSDGFVFSRWSDGVTDISRTLTVGADTSTLTAQFVPSVNVTAAAWPPEGGRIHVSVLPPEGGSLDSGVKYPSNSEQTIKLTAAATYGWRFTRWFDGDTNPVSRSITLGADTNLTAFFEQEYGEVVGVASPPDAGAVEGGGVYTVGAAATLTAHSTDANYVFSQWQDGMTNTTRTVAATLQTQTLTAKFVPGVLVRAAASPPWAGSIAVSPPPPEGGSLEDGVKFASNALQAVTLTETPNELWRFTHWSDGATSPTRSVGLAASRDLAAIYWQQVAMSVVADPATGGSVSGGGVYDTNTTVVIHAAPAAGWLFYCWSDGDTNPVRQLVVTADTPSLQAYFFMADKLVLNVSPPGAGVVTGAGMHPAMTHFTITAASTNQDFFRFAYWTDRWSKNKFDFNLRGYLGGGVSASRTVELAQATTTFTAYFLPVGRVMGVANPPEAGKVANSGAPMYGDRQYDVGSNVTRTAVSTNAHYVFSRWDDGVSTAFRKDVVVTGLNVHTAQFVTAVLLHATATPANGGAVKVAPLPPEGGVLSAGVKYASNTTVTITAVPINGWRFAGWLDGSSTNAARVETLRFATNLVANFIPLATVSVQSSPTNGGAVAGGGAYDVGADATLTAAPRDGWVFKGWQDGSLAPTQVVSVASNASYTAFFASTARITVQASPGMAGLATGGGVFEWLTVIDLAAVTTNAAYRFDHWLDGNRLATREVTVTGPTNYTAVFLAVAQPAARTASSAAGGISSAGGAPAVPASLTLAVDAWGPLPPTDQEGADLLLVAMHLGRPVIVVAGSDSGAMPCAWRADLQVQGVDANGNGLPDDLDTALGALFSEGTVLMRVRCHGGSAVAETPFGESWLIKTPAVPLGQTPARWRITPVSFPLRPDKELTSP